MDPKHAERRLAAIVFSDVVDYTARMAESEEAGLLLRRRHRSLFASLAERNRGEIVDENGDELVLAFPSATDAVTAALAAQSELRGDPDLRLRIGVHQGDVIFEEGRVYGDGVNVASRIRPLAEPGGVCVSEPVYDSVKNQPHVSGTSLGPQRLKNVSRPVEVFAVVEAGAEGAPAARSATPARRGRSSTRLLAALAALVVSSALALFALWPRPRGCLPMIHHENVDSAGDSRPSDPSEGDGREAQLRRGGSHRRPSGRRGRPEGEGREDSVLAAFSRGA